MKYPIIIAALSASLSWGCESKAPSEPAAPAEAPVVKKDPPKTMGPPLDANNIVSIAIASKDHTTLVAALQAANYVTSVSNAGPLTVFAPTNAAFEALPAGTVETLLKPENADKLRQILKYHATTAVYLADAVKDGQLLGMANGLKVTLHVTDGKLSKVNDANVIASVRASNGVVHIIDGVLLPPE